MPISGNDPSSVILSQTQYFQKLKRDVPNVPKQAEAKRDGVINPQNYNFNTEIFDALIRYESTEVDRRTWLHVSSGTHHWSTSIDTHQVVEI